MEGDADINREECVVRADRVVDVVEAMHWSTQDSVTNRRAGSLASDQSELTVSLKVLSTSRQHSALTNNSVTGRVLHEAKWKSPAQQHGSISITYKYTVFYKDAPLLNGNKILNTV